MFRQIGPWEIVIILFILLLLFGAKRLPELGRSLGRSMKEFKSGITGDSRDSKDEDREEDSEASESKAPRGGG